MSLTYLDTSALVKRYVAETGTEWVRERTFAAEHPLRAYDVVHLATGWLANRELVQADQPPLTFISVDDRLLDVAVAVGLLTDNPNRYP